MSKLLIESIEQLRKLSNLNWNNPYTQRQFIIENFEQVDYLIKNYRENFAYGFDYKNNHFGVMKENGMYYIRQDNNCKFDTPPVSQDYNVKSSNIQDILNFVDAFN